MNRVRDNRGEGKEKEADFNWPALYLFFEPAPVNFVPTSISFRPVYP
jgi:hypothetical protein